VVPDALAIAVPAAWEKPNAARAACAVGSEDEAEIEKLAALGALIVTAPLSTDDGGVAPVIVSIAESRLPTVPEEVLMTKGLPDVLVGAVDEKLMVVPLTVMVSPFAKPAERELVPAAPESAVELVIACGGVCWLVATAPVAELDGSKNSCPASMADAATSEVFATLAIAVFSAVFKFAAVVAGSGKPPGNVAMAKLLAGGGVVFDAVNCTESVVPSGRLNVMPIWSPGLGLVVPKVTEKPLGEPDGGVTVTLVSVEETALSFNPKGDPAASSETENDEVGVAGSTGAVVTTCEIVRRPRPVVPSACARSAITCFKPAWVVVPLRMESVEATAGV